MPGSTVVDVGAAPISARLGADTRPVAVEDLRACGEVLSIHSEIPAPRIS